MCARAIDVYKRQPVYVAADSMVNDGGLATVGVNYTNLGTQTADMLLKVLTGTPVCEVPVELSLIHIYNTAIPFLPLSALRQQL